MLAQHGWAVTCFSPAVSFVAGRADHEREAVTDRAGTSPLGHATLAPSDGIEPPANGFGSRCSFR